MTASTLSQLPIMVGSVLIDNVSRAGSWALSRYMSAPLASTGLVALVTLTALAGSNALYFQTTTHPSPFFVPARAEVAILPTPVTDRPAAEEAVSVLPTLPVASTQPAVAQETTGSVTPVVPDTPVGNAQMFAVQKKLYELKIFTGTVDGYYGPRTASAIREFELRNGMTPTGSTDPKVMEAILSSDASGRAAVQPQAAVQPAPQPVVQPVVQQAVAPAPAPVAAPQPVAPVVQQTDQVVARLPALSPAEQVFDDVAQTAHNTIDSIISGLDSSRSGSNASSAPPIPTTNVAVVPAQTQPMPQPVVQPAPQPVAAVQAAPVQAARAPQANVQPANDTELVMQIQRGLASLGFFRAPVDGKPGPETARAIREFENFYRYKMTGQVQPDLVDLLIKAGATI
ncbi:MAG: peptidoglycan-binding protein [Phyllobacteriaceae bacterium]|nr:peptidoglycan-binding protein [Phyllobacteriaceae bacterium]